MTDAGSGDGDTFPHRVDIPPGRLVSRGHPAGDFLEAYDWEVLEEDVGRLRIAAHLPAHLLNPQKQLFGGFTPAYVDLVSLHAVRAGPDRRAAALIPGHWTATVNMRVDYYEPIIGPRFIVESEVEHRRGKMSLVATRMYQDDVLATFAITTMRSMQLPG